MLSWRAAQWNWFDDGRITVSVGRSRRNRTYSLRFWRPLLCQLSYAPILLICISWWCQWGSNPQPPPWKGGDLANSSMAPYNYIIYKCSDNYSCRQWKIGAEGGTWTYMVSLPADLSLLCLPILPHQNETSHFPLSVMDFAFTAIRRYGASGGDRTHDLQLKRRLLCQLSYWCVYQPIIICKVSENYSTTIRQLFAPR